MIRMSGLLLNPKDFMSRIFLHRVLSGKSYTLLACVFSVSATLLSFDHILTQVAVSKGFFISASIPTHLEDSVSVNV